MDANRLGKRNHRRTGMTKTTGLYSAESGFPAMVANIADGTTRQIGEFGYGLESASLAASLHALADAVESAMVIPQNVSHLVEATIDDFAMHVLSFKFAAKRPT